VDALRTKVSRSYASSSRNQSHPLRQVKGSRPLFSCPPNNSSKLRPQDRALTLNGCETNENPKYQNKRLDPDADLRVNKLRQVFSDTMPGCTHQNRYRSMRLANSAGEDMAKESGTIKAPKIMRPHMAAE
jgi:hypothetical protein